MTGDGIALGYQLAAGGVAIILMTVVHAVGLIGIFRLLRVHPEHFEDRNINLRSILRISLFGVALFSLHLFEISLFAIFYHAVGTIDGAGDALHLSAATYATLGVPETIKSPDWRPIPPLQALIGFVQITWSTAFIVSSLDRLRQ